MRYIEIFIFTLLIFLLATSCDQPSHDDLIIIEPINSKNPLNVDITDLVDSISYVPIETSAKCLLGNIQKVLFAENLFVIQDQYGLYAFNSSGEFISEISDRGNGPTDYIHIDSFFIDHINKLIGIVCGATKKLLYYDFAGVYKHSFRFKKSSDACVINMIEVLPDASLLTNYCLSSSAFPTDSQYKLLSHFNDRVEVKELIEASNIDTEEMGVNPYIFNPLAFYGNYLALMPMSNYIWEYSGEEMYPRYQVITKNPLVDDNYIRDNWSGDAPEFIYNAYINGKSPGLLRLHSTDKYLFVSDSYYDTIIWDGDSSIILGNVTHRDLNIGGGALVSGIADNCWGIYDSSFLLDSKEKITDTKLKCIINEMNHESNPILFRYHFKKDLIELLRNQIFNQ